MDKEQLKEVLRKNEAECICYGEKEFFLEAEKYILAEAPNRELCIIAIDVEHFKLFNEWFGREKGDKFLTDIAVNLKAACDKTGGVCGYLGEDNFSIVMPHTGLNLNILEDRILNKAAEYEDSVGFLPGFGVSCIDDVMIPVATMYDRASIALENIKGNYSRRMNTYEKGMMLKMEEEHNILKQIPKALLDREFTFQLQPKCNMINGKIIGAEALIRWIKPDGTVVMPSDFIPILEKNGFITSVDKFIWEEVCHFQKGLIDRGIRPVPISINVSSMDIQAMKVSKHIGNLMHAYHLDPKLIEVEITESAYAEKLETVNYVVQSLRNKGMHVSMDDFGSGYSSLNMLNDVNIDVLKIDMKFLNINKKEMGKGVGILEAVINMAKMMGIKVIVEGVESMEQVDFLIRMGCEYAQGYFYYKPVSIEEFEKLLINERSRIDYNGIKLKKNDQLHIRELLNENLFSETIVNNILGAIAFVEVYGDKVEVIRTNDTYKRTIMMGEHNDDVRHQFPMQSIIPEDRAVLTNIFTKAFLNPLEGASGEIRYRKDDGKMVCYRIRVFYLRENNGKKLYYGSIIDITPEKQQELELSIAEKQLEGALRLSKINCFDWNLTEDKWSLVNTYATEAMKLVSDMFNEKYIVINGFSNVCKKHLRVRVVNYREAKMFFENFVMGKDITPKGIDICLSVQKTDVLWFSVSCEAILDISGKVSHIIGSFKDSTEDIILKNQLEKQATTDELTGLYNRHGGITLIKSSLKQLKKKDSAALIMIDLDNFKKANDTYGHQFGDKLLIEVGDTLAKTFRDRDIICRLGGDEFMVFCSGIDKAAMERKAAEVVRKISHINGGEKSYNASCSIGYVMTELNGRRFKDLYKKADEAMFEAKKLGKNIFYEYKLSE